MAYIYTMRLMFVTLRCPLPFVHILATIAVAMLSNTNVFFTVQETHAQTVSEWSLTPSSTDWFDPLNWKGVVPNFPGAIARFQRENAEVELAANATLGKAEFIGVREATLSGAGLLRFENPGADPAVLSRIRNRQGDDVVTLDLPIAIGNGEDLHLGVSTLAPLRLNSGIVSANGRVAKIGSGRLILSGDSSAWQGEFTVAEGDVVLEHVNALGGEIGATTVDGGRVLIGDDPIPPRGTPRSELDGPLNETFILNSGVLETTQHLLRLNGSLELLAGNTATVRGPFDLRGGSTGDGNLRIVATGLAATSFADTPLAHAGGVDISSGESSRQFVEFRTDNTYAGPTQLTNVTLSVWTPNGLGSAAESTTINDGTLTLHGGAAESVIANNSILGLWSAEEALPELRATGTFTLASSTLDTQGSFRGADVYKIDKAIVLNGGLNEITTTRGGIQLLGGVVGNGDLLLNPSGIYAIEVAGNIEHDGTLEVRGGGSVRFAAPSAYSKDLAVRNGGRIVVEAPQTFGTISTATRGTPCCSPFGDIEVASGSSLTADAVNLFQGSLQGNVQIAGPLQFRGFAGRRTIRNLESGIDVAVYGGELAIDDSDQNRKATNGRISIFRESEASVLLNRDFVTDASFMLNNGSGFNFGGAFRVDNEGSGTPSIFVRGDIDLGSRGAHIGGAGGVIVEGQIRGGDLNLGRVVGAPSLTVVQDSLHYAGKTNIFSGSIQLKDAGRLQNTNGIDVFSKGAIFVGSSVSDGPLSDRIADNIPISLFGGELSVWPTEPDVDSLERVGRVNAVRGLSALHGVKSNDRNDQAIVRLEVGELARSRGAVITTRPYRDPGFAFGQLSQAPLLLDNAPPVTNGILPAWVIEDVNFTTLNDDGHVVGYQGPFESFDGAGETSIVRPSVDPSILSEDKVVHAVYAFGNAGPVDFGGHTVTVGNGGVSGADFSNGTIQPGDHADGELILFGGVHIDVDIVDNGMPTSVTIVGDAELGGSNTYTGKTYIVGRPGDNVTINNASALPTGGDIEISGYTELNLRDLSGNNAYQFGSVAIRDGGSFGANCCGNGDTVTATNILLEEGRLSVPLVGDTVITKLTEGLGKITMASPGFTGRVEIQQGSLLAGESRDGYTSLGAADVIVHADANLILSPLSEVLAPGTPNPNIMFQGGALFGTGSLQDGQVNLKGTVEVLEPSRIYLMDGLESNPESADITIDGKIHVPAGQSLSVIGIFNSRRGLSVSEGFELDPGSILGGTGSIRSNLVISDDAILSPGLLSEGSTIGTIYMSVPIGASERDESSLTWGENGRYRWEINSVEGLAGADFNEGWDLVNAGGELLIDATAENPFVIEIVGLDGDGNHGAVDDLMTNINYRWKIAEVAQINAFVGTIAGFDPEKFTIDVSHLREFYPRVREEDFFLERVGPEIFLNGLIVPEPSSMMILLGMSVLTYVSRRYLRHGH